MIPRMRHAGRGFLTATLVLLGAGAARGGPPEADEAVAPQRSADALPASLRDGPDFHVRADGVTEGFLTRWELESRFGLFVCASRRLLEERVHEVETMAKAVGRSGESEAIAGLRGRLEQMPTTAVKLVEDPVATVGGALEGAKRTLGRVGDLFSKRKASEYETAGPDNLLFAAEKRKIAAELGVDVYSTNAKLQEFITELARARRMGGLAVDLAKMAVPGGAGTAVSALATTADATAIVRDSTPAEVDRFADEALDRAGVARPLRQAFLSNRALSPRHRAAIADAARRLAGVQNLGALVSAASESGNEAQALMHEQQALYLAAHHAAEPLASLDASGGLVAAFSASGRMVVPVPVDVVSYNADVVAAVDVLLTMPGAANAPVKTIWITGKATPRARALLESRRFTVVEDARVPAAAPR
jgi:hypothetical protein